MAAGFMYRNYFDAATVTSTIPALAGYSLDELKKRELSATCRLPVAGSPAIVIDLGGVKSIGGIAVLGTNHRVTARSSADLKVEMAASAGGPWTVLTALLPNDAG